MSQNVQRLFLLAATAALIGPNAKAHFPWLTSDNDGRALLYFAESPHKTDYHMPEAVAEAVVTLRTAKDKANEIELDAVDTDDFVGRKSDADVVQSGVLTTTCPYGNYHGTMLSYYVKHYAGDLASALEVEPKESPEGFALDVRPKLVDNGVELTVTRDNKPVEGASVTVVDPDGETADKETDSDGVAKFHNLPAGPLAFIVGVTEDTDGEVDGEKYNSKSHYLTLTFDTTAKPDESQQSALPLLPDAIASFGAAVVDDTVYVYSGHTGTAHAHSRDNLSQHFSRISLDGGEWESLPIEQPLQGFPLVPHGGKIYRVGGMHATNAAEDEEDLHSVDTFAVFDPNTKEWTDLAPLPEPRSSHDAVVIDGWLYVVGGWQLSGTEDGEWHETAWRIDLANPVEWVALPKSEFLRRALATSYAGNLLVAIGGIDDEGEISRRVNALNLDTGEWQQLSDLPGDGMHGFGVSAWNHGGNLYVSGSAGEVYQLLPEENKWQSVAKLGDRRFFHRLLPAGDNRLLMIGGASIDRHGHVADSEWVSLPTN